jgi:hypothetical protein
MMSRQTSDGRRSGASTLGCLFTLLVMAVVVYFAVNGLEVYWNYVEFRDEMRQQAQFASQHTNDQIIRRLRIVADSLGLPEDAQQIAVNRGPNKITIEAEYDAVIQLPFTTRTVHFDSRAEGSY